MPLTPFHFGPGALIKAWLPRRFSLLVFCYAQVLMDIEVVYRVFSRQLALHGPLHSYPGALAVALVCAVTSRPLYLALNFCWRLVPGRRIPLSLPEGRVILFSAIVGTLSHVLLDSIMHPDLEPFWPFASGNPCLDLLSFENLHIVCVLTLIGGALWYSLGRFIARNVKPEREN